MYCVWCVLLFVSVCVSQNDYVERETVFGTVRGKIIPNVANGDPGALTSIESFLAVPFGNDTSGANRFRRPERPPSWSGVRDALHLGDMCPQGGGTPLQPHFQNVSEDCLHVNIYVPTDVKPVEGFPVFVWFYGGAFQSGQNVLYPGHFLASRGVVVVVANYRVGDFGFAFTDSDACRGNMGLWDQHLALQFVQENIADFEGNPNKVTIGGQSAGAASVGHHMLSPASVGLFHQAFLVSGTETNFWAINYPEAHPETFIWQIAEDLNCADDRTDDEMLDCLREIPWDDLRRASMRCTPGHYCLGMAPVVDGEEGGFIPMKPHDLRASGSFSQIPVIAGNTDSDGSFYTIGMIPESLLGGFTYEEFLFHLEHDLISIWSPAWDNKTTENVVRALDYNYSPWPYLHNEYQNREAFNKMITDCAFGYPRDRLMKQQCAHHEDVYSYIYGYRGRNATSLVPEWMAVPHAGDLPQVWGWPLLPENPEVREDCQIYDDIIDWTQEDKVQTRYWNTMLSNFFKTGNPTPEPVANPLGGTTTWPKFNMDTQQVMYVYNTTQEALSFYHQEEYAFFTDYMTYMTRDYDMPL